MKHIFHLTFALLAGMALCACSSDDPMDNDQTPVPVQPGEAGSDDSWSVKIEGDMTRGLSLSGTTLTPNFNGEKIYVYYGDAKVGTLTAPSGNVTGDKTLTGSLNNATYTKGQSLSLYFLKDKGTATYTGQQGTIDNIASSFDYATATATITNVDNNTHTLTISKATFTSQQAIIGFKFTEDLASSDVITIKQNNADGTTKATVTSPKVTKNSTIVYVALPLTASDTQYTYYFDIKRGSSAYCKGTLALDANHKMRNGKYYSAQTVTLYKHMTYAINRSGSTLNDIKKVVAVDGFLYPNTSTATSIGGSTNYPTGILAYLSRSYSSETSKASGIVLSYYNGPKKDYPSINQTVLNTNQKTKPTGGSAWKLPTSITDWNHILQSLTGQTSTLNDNANSNYAYVAPGNGAAALGSSENVSIIYWHNTGSSTSIKCYRGGKNYGCLTGTAQSTNKTGSSYENYVRPISTF